MAPLAVRKAKCTVRRELLRHRMEALRIHSWLSQPRRAPELQTAADVRFSASRSLLRACATASRTSPSPESRESQRHGGAASIHGPLPCAGLFQTAGRLFDQGGDGTGVGDIDSVTARHLDDGGAGPLRHELLCGIRNHLVVADLEIPARLGLPSRLVTAPPRASMPHGTWESAMKAAVFESTSPAKELRKFGLVKKQVTVPGRQNRRYGRARRRIGDQAIHGLALVRGERGDVRRLSNARDSSASCTTPLSQLSIRTGTLCTQKYPTSRRGVMR